MTINLTDPANHPANGLLAVERIIRVREELQRTLWHKNGSTIDYVTADAIKGLEELLVSREAVPVAWSTKDVRNGEQSLYGCLDSVNKALSENQWLEITPLYTAPPGPQSSKMSGIMPDYEGVAMTQRECYMAGREAGLAEARKSPVIPDGWIQVSERMPEEAEPLGGDLFSPDVLTQNQDGDMHVCRTQWGKWIHKKSPDDVITHWQPLPAAPQEVKS